MPRGPGMCVPAIDPVEGARGGLGRARRRSHALGGEILRARGFQLDPVAAELRAGTARFDAEAGAVARKAVLPNDGVLGLSQIDAGLPATAEFIAKNLR